MRKSFFLFFMVASFATFQLTANGDLNSEQDKKLVHTGQIDAPNPHICDLAEPVAMYTISTATVDITFDATYYSEYTVHLVGEYTEQDIFVNSQVVYIPVATFGDIVDIYIESDDCGSYYGVLDQSAYTNTY